MFELVVPWYVAVIYLMYGMIAACLMLLGWIEYRRPTVKYHRTQVALLPLGVAVLIVLTVWLFVVAR